MVITQEEHDARKEARNKPDENFTGESVVKSSSQPGISYTISKHDNELKCSCPHHTYRGAECKHIIKFKNGNRTSSGICASNQKQN